MESNTNGLVTDIHKINEYKKLEEQILYYNYDDYSLKGIIESSDLSNTFLSPQNKEDIQKSIRYGVYKKVGKIISDRAGEQGLSTGLTKTEIWVHFLKCFTHPSAPIHLDN